MVFVQENAFENIVCQMSFILFWLQYVDTGYTDVNNITQW